jgi:hypothetical protein
MENDNLLNESAEADTNTVTPDPEITNTTPATTDAPEAPPSGEGKNDSVLWAISQLFEGKNVTHESFPAGVYIFHQPDNNPENPGCFIKYTSKQNALTSFQFGAAELKLESGWKIIE